MATQATQATQVTQTHADTLTTGDTLPARGVHTVDGATLLLRPSPHRAAILVVPHAGRCDHCDAYLRKVSEAASSFGRWDATVFVVADGDDADRLDAATSLPVVVHEALRRRSLGEGTGAAVVVADRHGEVWDAAASTEDHSLPGIDELEEDVKFIAIQCPECDVLDIPGLGEWEPSPDA